MLSVGFALKALVGCFLMAVLWLYLGTYLERRFPPPLRLRQMMWTTDEDLVGLVQIRRGSCRSLRAKLTDPRGNTILDGFEVKKYGDALEFPIVQVKLASLYEALRARQLHGRVELGFIAWSDDEGVTKTLKFVVKVPEAG